MTTSGRRRRVFILYPAGVRSGGPEALHQLCDALLAEGVEAYLVPLEPGKGVLGGAADPVEYHHYRRAYRAEVPDADDVTVVVPEIAVSRARRFRRSLVVVWWLSIDFAEPFVHRMAVERGERSFGGRLAHAVRVIAPWRPERSARGHRRLLAGVRHAAQSRYAQDFLLSREGIEAQRLSDYIHAADRYGVLPGDRRPLSVAYNPAKGGGHVEALRALTPELSWHPLGGLSRREVEDLLESVEVYVDLGHHPGKDRIPREAALAGCVVVVAARGSAAYPDDVPIQDALRIPVDEGMPKAVERAARVLRLVLADPGRWRRGQDAYRRVILGQEEVFRAEVRALFLQA